MKSQRLIGIFFYGVIITALVTLLVWSGRTNKPRKDPWEDMKFILNEIVEVSIPENVSSETMTVYSREAFPILVASPEEESTSFLHPIVTAGRYGKGKFAAYGHHSFLISPNATGNDRLLVNIAKWEVKTIKPVKPYKIGLCVDHGIIDTFHKIFNDKGTGFNSHALNCSNNELENFDYLQQYNVILLSGRMKISDNETETLKKYVASGGGIILGADRSSFKHRNASSSFWGNSILNSIGGVAFSYNSLLATGPKLLNITEMKSNDFKDLKSTHAYYALENFKKFIDDIRRDPDCAKCNWEFTNQIKSILDARIWGAPKDSNFSSEITEQVAKLLTTNTHNGTITASISFLKPFYPSEMWNNVLKNSSQVDGDYIQNGKVDEIVKGLRIFINDSDHKSYSNILSQMIDESIKIIHSKRSGQTGPSENKFVYSVKPNNKP